MYIGLPLSFLLCTAVAAVTEFVCAAVLVGLFGHNPFWDYTGQPLNLFGFIDLRNCLAFGVVAVPTLYWIFPFFNNLLIAFAKRSPRWLNVGFWILAVSYFAIQFGVLKVFGVSGF